MYKLDSLGLGFKLVMLMFYYLGQFFLPCYNVIICLELSSKEDRISHNYHKMTSTNSITLQCEPM